MQDFGNQLKSTISKTYKKVGEYTVIGDLGEGSFGKVFKCVNNQNEIVICIFSLH